MLANRMLMAASASAYNIPFSGDYEATESDVSTFTPSGAGDSTVIYTLATWFKRESTGSFQSIVAAYVDGSNVEQIIFRSDNTLDYQLVVGGGVAARRNTTATYTDTTNWHHLMFRRTSGTVEIYIDGTLITAFGTSSGPSPTSQAGFFNTATAHYWGNDGSGSYFDGKMADQIILDGTYAAIGSFYDAGSPVNPSGLGFGTNGSWVSDPSTGTDGSGNGNDWTPTGVAQSADTPTA